MAKASKAAADGVFDEAAMRKLDALTARSAEFDRDSSLDAIALEDIPEVTAFDGAPLEKLRGILVILHRLKKLGAEKGRGGRPRPGPEVALLESALGVALSQSEAPQHILLEILERYAEWGGPISRVQALHSALIETERTAEANGRLGFHLRLAASMLLNALRPAANELDGPKRENWEKRFKSFEPKLNEGLCLKIEPGEAWSDAAISDDSAMEPEDRAAWYALFDHCEQMPRSARPSEKWLRTSRERVDGIGLNAFLEHVVRWFALVDKPRTIPVDQPAYGTDSNHLILDAHLVYLRGLVWSCAGESDREVARSLAKLALSSYRKLPGIGARLISLGNACVAVLGSLPSLDAIGQLAMLKTRVKFGTAQREIEKAFDAAAKREGLPRAEIEELSVPGYGMEEVGKRIESFGEYTAALSVDHSGVAIRWSKADGSPLKSVPAAIKKEHAEDWKEFQAAAKDAEKMLTTVRDRLDSLFLARKTWPYATWRERYLDHPLVGVVARRLIWTLEDAGGSRDAVFAEGRLVDDQGNEIEAPGDGTTVALWHPIGRSVDDVLGWRARLEQFEIRQPFKQAHREVYLLTDAERRTATYSNRFAAHILKQHQFQALCVARGWKSKLRLMVDDSYPPASRLLPEWGLRAEFWVEGIGDEYGEDTNDQGTYLYLASDQVRFYPIDAAHLMAHASGGGYSTWGRDEPGNRPLPLEEVPPLVLSEVMRDVDLFVGVASVGNDPNWADGGRHVDYWQEYNFGDLSATAQTRKAVLERLIPRLKIADRCRFADRFLIVRGDLRTYKIHLGSGNIVMEPNDQYLCIVPKPSSGDPAQGNHFLPFEGDKVLSIILSKALMLADDRKIKDATITSQIASKS